MIYEILTTANVPIGQPLIDGVLKQTGLANIYYTPLNPLLLRRAQLSTAQEKGKMAKKSAYESQTLVS